jgi:hypothetical protein
MNRAPWQRTSTQEAQGAEPVPLVERLAYVLREWEESHATWSDRVVVNGSHYRPRTDQEIEQGTRADEVEEYGRIKTECECSHCKDARTVLADYEKRGGDDKAERIRY